MTEEQARERIAGVFAKYVKPHLSSASLGEPDLLSEHPMDLEAEVIGQGVMLSVIERSPDDETPCRTISARQPGSVAVGDFNTLVSIDPESIGFERAIAIAASVSEPGIFFRLLDDNIELEPSDFAEMLREHQQEED